MDKYHDPKYANIRTVVDYYIRLANQYALADKFATNLRNRKTLKKTFRLPSDLAEFYSEYASELGCGETTAMIQALRTVKDAIEASRRRPKL